MNVYTNQLALAEVLEKKDLFETRFYKDSSGRVEYVAKTYLANASTAEPVWAIMKFHYDGTGFCERIQMPDLGEGYRYIADDITTYFS